MSTETGELTWLEFTYQIFTELERDDENDKFLDMVLWEFTAFPLAPIAEVYGQLVKFHDTYRQQPTSASPSLPEATP